MSLRMSNLLLGGGGRGFRPAVGKGGPALRFSGFFRFRVASLSGVTLVIWVWGRVVPVLSGPRWALSGALFPGSTIVLEGIVERQT